MTDVKDFLYNFFAQRHFDLMSPDVRARFDDYNSRGDFPSKGHMKDWANKYIDTTATPPVNKPLPTLTDNADFEELYKLFQKVFQRMYENIGSFDKDKDASAIKKLNEWFGPGKTFNYSQMKDDAKAVIGTNASAGQGTLLWVLENYQDQLADIFDERGFTDDVSYKDLIKGIKDEKYNTDDKFRKTLRRVMNYVQRYQSMGSKEDWPEDDKCHVNFNGLKTDDMFKVDLSNLGDFKRKYMNILGELVSNKGLRAKFTEYDSSKDITEKLNEALGHTGYDNKESKDFVSPLPEKTPKNLIECVKKWKEETYEQYFRKLTSSIGSRKFFSVQAHEIFKAIDKEKVKPIDGIDGIISKKDAIIKRLGAQSPTTNEHFKWFEEAMVEVKSLVPDSYTKAFKDGRKLKQVVSKVIAKAVKENKIEQAETALELLSVCKYGFTTSKTMNGLRNQNVTIFSDSKLSWNKNSEAMQFVSNAVDKTLGFGMKAIAQSAVLLRNIHQQQLSKFNGEKGELAPFIEHDKQQKQSIINQRRDNDIQVKNVNMQRLAQLNMAGGNSHLQINDTKMPALRADLNNRETLMKTAMGARDAAQKDFESKTKTFEAQKELYDNSEQDRQLLAAKERYDAAPAEIQAKESIRDALYNDLYTLTPGTPEEIAKSQEITKVEREIVELQQYIASNDSIFKNPDAELAIRLQSADKINQDYAKAEKEYNAASKARQTASANYDAAKNSFDELNSDITEYDNINKENIELDNDIQTCEDKIRNWDTTEIDNYRHLMGYWDKLQSFTKTHSFEIATLKMQEKNLQKVPGTNRTVAQTKIDTELLSYQYR